MTLESVLEGPCIFLLGFGFDSHSILCSYGNTVEHNYCTHNGR